KTELSSDVKRTADATINKARDTVIIDTYNIKLGADNAANQAKKSYVC
ncbi:unnamed protein product, partial [Rotaria sp. Silwood1]